jgi:hypothetical protein
MNYNLRPGYGIDELLFGMESEDVISILGSQYIKLTDEESNAIFIYNDLQIRLTFYAEENFRLGYIVCNHPKLNFKENLLIGRPFSEVKNEMKECKEWETQVNEDFITHHFNESFWIDFHEEFFKITKVELGATIKNLDEFDWKFPKK